MTARERPLILVADDDEDIRELIAFRLGMQGYDTVTARDGEEALDVATEQSPDLAVIDVTMPKLTGYEVTRRLRAADATRGMPVLLLTAKVQEADIEDAFAAGADDYMKKPFNAQELGARVQTILGAAGGHAA